MPRPKAARRTIPKKVYIYEDLEARAFVLLFSELQGRVPLGEWSKLFNTLLEQALARAAIGTASPASQENP